LIANADREIEKSRKRERRESERKRKTEKEREENEHTLSSLRLCFSTDSTNLLAMAAPDVNQQWFHTLNLIISWIYVIGGGGRKQ